VYAAQFGETEIQGAGGIVVTICGISRQALSAETGIGLGAEISVFAWAGIEIPEAAQYGKAEVIRADRSVIAGDGIGRADSGDALVSPCARVPIVTCGVVQLRDDAVS
jgi:hypothetical protein